MPEQKKDVKASNSEQQPTKRIISTSKTRSGVQAFNDGFIPKNSDKKSLNETKK